MGIIQYLNNNASALGIIGAILSGVIAIVVLIWKVAIRYQMIEHQFLMLHNNIEDKFEVLQDCLNLNNKNLEEKIDYMSSRMDETSEEINSINDRLINNMKDIAVIEAHLEHKRL